MTPEAQKLGIKRRAWPAALAFAATIAAHSISYAAVSDSAHAHERLLSSTGHGYWPIVAAGALAALVFAFVGLIAESRGDAVERTPGWAGRLFACLASLQVGAFLLLELLERVISGAPADLWSQPAVILGVVLQAVVALASALLVLLIRRVLTPRGGKTFTQDSLCLWLPVGPAHAAVKRIGTGCGWTVRGPPPFSFRKGPTENKGGI